MLQEMTRRCAVLGLALVVVGLVLGACSGGGSSGPKVVPLDPPAASTTLTGAQLSPGVVARILRLKGASGAEGNFRIGDRITVVFELEKDDQSAWGLGEMSFSSVLVSGPSFNNQRVLAERNDVTTRAVKNPSGSYSYTFNADLPGTYLAPLNDTVLLGALDGEMTGQALLSGTYAVGLGFAWSYTVDGAAHVDAGEVVFPFLVGGGTTLAPREVVRQENCDRCHVELRAHGGLRREVAMCVLCHTSGAEDLNDPMLGGGTPRVSVDSRVLFHKIHNGQHLPTVVGIGVFPWGALDYSQPAKNYKVAGSEGLRDYSGVSFPVFPSRNLPMPRDFLTSLLTPAEQALEERVRTGVTSCFVCHGDPDGAGPLGAPAQGDLIWSQPSRRACGACHDDVNWQQLYQVNGQVMIAQPDDTGCTVCHAVTGNQIAVKDGHLHPLLDPFYNSGLQVNFVSVAEAGAHNANGKLDPGEGVSIVFDVADDAGGALSTAQFDELRVVLSGPTTNPQVLLDVVVPQALMSGAQPFSVNLPESLPLEFVGDSSAALGDVLATARTPHLNLVGALTTVRVRTGTAGGASTLAQAAAAPQNYLDLADATGFARDDYLVIDDGGAGEEYLRVQFVEGDRLWFSSLFSPAYAPGLRGAHAAGASVLEVQLTAQTEGVDYLLDTVNGTLTELLEFGTGSAVVVDYWSEFNVPATYPAPLNDSPDLGEAAGEWAGKALVAGTYTVGLTARTQLDLFISAETNRYQVASPPASLDILVGSAVTLEPYDLISSGSNCNACHQDLSYHEGRYRGFESCSPCHSAAAIEDRPRYVSANAPATAGRSVSFRELLHGIHMGSALDDPAGLQVVGLGEAAYPDDFEVQSWSSSLFPALPDAAAHCETCHGASNTAWLEPTDRDHPAGQSTQVAEWTAVCAACHDRPAAVAHMQSNTAPSGAEACDICHAESASYPVDQLHITR